MTRCWLLIMIKLVSHFNRVNFLFDRFVPSQKFVRILWGKMPITILSTYFYKYFDLKQIPNFLSRHQKGPRPSAHCTLYIDSCTDTLYYCTHLVQMDCTCVYKTVHCCTTWHYLNTHLWCTHYARISCTTVRLYCSPVSVQMYSKLVLTNESPSITFLNRVDQSQSLLLDLPIPISPSHHHHHHHQQLNHSMLTTPFPRETDVVKKFHTEIYSVLLLDNFTQKPLLIKSFLISHESQRIIYNPFHTKSLKCGRTDQTR